MPRQVHSPSRAVPPKQGCTQGFLSDAESYGLQTATGCALCDELDVLPPLVAVAVPSTSESAPIWLISSFCCSSLLSSSFSPSSFLPGSAVPAFPSWPVAFGGDEGACFLSCAWTSPSATTAIVRCILLRRYSDSSRPRSSARAAISCSSRRLCELFPPVLPPNARMDEVTRRSFSRQLHNL